jgi:hypothetical protein
VFATPQAGTVLLREYQKPTPGPANGKPRHASKARMDQCPDVEMGEQEYF